MALHGRRVIYSPVEEITRENIKDVLELALAAHAENAADEDYLIRYDAGEQPILMRTKEIRPEICNKIVENRAAEIGNFHSEYFLSEPITYVQRGTRDGIADDITTLNDYMYAAGKEENDQQIVSRMVRCGVGYRMVLPNSRMNEGDAPFVLDAPDPRRTFVVYSSGFGHRKLLGARIIYRNRKNTNNPLDLEQLVYGYTDTHYFEYIGGAITEWEPHILGEVPVYEYRWNTRGMCSFEIAIPLMDALNSLQSNRMDGVEQYVQSFLKFVNCDIDEAGIENLRSMGAIKIKSSDGMQGDVQLISQELNQSQTQTLVDDLCDSIFSICAMPASATNGSASTSDTGSAVYLRNGYVKTEMVAKEAEDLFKPVERDFLRMVIKIIRYHERFQLKPNEVDTKLPRRQYDNMYSKTQVLLNLLNAGIAPREAIALSGVTNDPTSVAAASEPYLKKWEYKEFIEEDGEEDEALQTDRVEASGDSDNESEEVEPALRGSGQGTGASEKKD